MAKIVGGLGCSHAPSIAHVYDSKKTREPEWEPLFSAFDRAQEWLMALGADALVVIYNDHVDHFPMTSWPQFAIGVGENFEIADEGFEPRDFPPVPGHPDLAMHLATELVANDVDISVAYEQVVDHGILSPLPVINNGWALPIVPIEINVVFDPRPSPRRCWHVGAALGEAIASYDPNFNVAVIGTGGLSHQLTTDKFGTVRPEWDRKFLELIQHRPGELLEYSTEQFEKLGGHDSVEVVQWMAMRAALPAGSTPAFEFYYPREVMGYGIVGFNTPK